MVINVQNIIDKAAKIYWQSLEYLQFEVNLGCSTNTIEALVRDEKQELAWYRSYKFNTLVLALHKISNCLILV